MQHVIAEDDSTDTDSDRRNAELSEADAFVAKPNVDERLEQVKYFLR